MLFVPQTLVSGWRWARMVEAYQPIGTWRATELVLATSSLNLLLPAKSGDLLKGAHFQNGIWLALFEKALDAVALATLMLAAALAAPPTEGLGWSILIAAGLGVLSFAVLCGRSLVGPPASPTSPLARLVTIIQPLLQRPGRCLALAAGSLLLWTLHLTQFSLVLQAVGGTELAQVWSRVPMAIFIGLLPISLAGIGTRDAAMVYFLGPVIGSPAALALGAFATLRYLLPALAGLPLVGSLKRSPPS